MPDGSLPASIPPFIPHAAILDAVAATLGTTADELRGKRVLSGLNAARQIAAMLFAEFTLLSAVEMGMALGRKNTSAGGYMLRTGRERLAIDPRFRSAFGFVRARLLGELA